MMSIRVLILALMGKQKPRVPISGMEGPNGEPFYAPEGREVPSSSAPAWLRNAQPYPVNLPAALEGALMSTGMSGGPAGAVTSAVRHAGRSLAASPLVQALGLGGGALALTSGDAGSGEPSTLDRLLGRQAELARQRAAAIAERDAQTSGKNGAKAGRGPNYDKSVAEIERIDRQSSELTPLLKAEQERARLEEYNKSPQGQLEAQQKRKAFEDEQAAKDRGKPVRENLPSWAQDLVIPASTIAGVALTRHLTGKSNAEYQRALDRFMNGQKTGDVAAMALGKAQLAELEKPSIMGAAKTAGSALLPAEVRGLETAIDLAKPNDTRAHQEANDRIHDPWALAREMGTTGASSLFAYGAGSKTARPHVDRSLGRAIANGNPYAGAPQLADDYGTALRLSEDLRMLGQTGHGAPAQPPTAPASSASSSLVRALAAQDQGQLPPPSGASSPTDLAKALMDSPANRNFAGHHSRYQKRDSDGSFTRGRPEYPDKD